MVVAVAAVGAGDARGLGHHLVQRHEVLVIHQLAGDHGHRLGRAAQRLGGLADGHGAGGVGAAAFRGFAQARAVDAGRAQLQRAVGVDRGYHAERPAAGDDHLQVVARQRPLQGLQGAHLAVDGRRPLAGDQARIEGDHLPALPGDGVEGFRQTGGGQVEALHLLLDGAFGPDEGRGHGSQGDGKGEGPGFEHVDSPEWVGVIRREVQRARKTGHE